jgi:hypothetical protein
VFVRSGTQRSDRELRLQTFRLVARLGKRLLAVVGLLRGLRSVAAKSSERIVMTRIALVASLVAVLSACSSSQPSSAAPIPEAATCTPEGRCGACLTCFDRCLCGGGTTARCAESCVEPNDSGTSAGADSGDATSARFTATLVTEAFEIPPGEEFFRCQNFENPFGRDMAVLETDSFMTAGSHHLLVFIESGVRNESLGECSGSEFGPILHLAQRSQQRTGYPPGVGRLLSAKTGIRIQIHYLNATPRPIKTEIAVTVRADMPEAVPLHASGIFVNAEGIDVKPHSSGSVETRCPVMRDIKVLSMVSHMHRRGVRFTARADDGQLLYDTNLWSDPEPWTFEPPRDLKAGTWIGVHCDFENESDFSLSYGESANTNEMCILLGTYYPAASGESVTCLL